MGQSFLKHTFQARDAPRLTAGAAPNFDYDCFL